MTGDTGAARTLGRVLRGIDLVSGALAVLAAAALVALAANVVADVIGRAFFNTPVTGTLEMTSYWWMPMLVLLAFAWTEREQEHIRVTILLDALPGRMRRIVEGCFGGLAAALLAVLAWHSLNEALDSAAVGQTTASSPPTAIWPFKFAAPLGAGALALQAAATAARRFAGLPRRGRRRDREADPG